MSPTSSTEIDDPTPEETSQLQYASGAQNGAHIDTTHRLEKASPVLAPELEEHLPTHNDSQGTGSTTGLLGFIKKTERSLVQYNLEARGIQRVLPEHRHTTRRLGFVQVSLIWISINLAANNITLGMLGPAVFYLSFLDSALCAVFGMLIGSVPVAYVATFGPRSGNRTMVFARYTMGWWPSKLIVILTLIILIGYSLIDVVVAGQILSAVSSNGSLSIIVGIVITAVISWAVTTFGYSIFHYYQRYAWLPQLIVVMILAGVSGPKFDQYSNPSAGTDPRTLAGNRLSFFSICLSSAITYTEAAADFFVYYPEDISRAKVFTCTLTGLISSFTPMFIIGIGLASGMASNPAWERAYGISQGALIVEGYRPLGTFGSFCSVVMALGLISNIVAPTYASGIDWQALGRHFEMVPRFVWNTFSVIIYTVCAIAGRANLAEIFTNFLALMGYWVSIWVAIIIEEHLIFRKYRGLGWNWEAWNDPKKLPVGIAAFIAFIVGWVGAILCMAQVWYIGPISAEIGEYGGDLGNYVGFAWAAIFYAPLRWFELKRFER